MKKEKSLEDYTFKTIDEIAELSSLHRKTIAKFVQTGILKSRKIGKRRLISVKDYMRFVDSQNNRIA